MAPGAVTRHSTSAPHRQRVSARNNSPFHRRAANCWRGFGQKDLSSQLTRRWKRIRTFSANRKTVVLLLLIHLLSLLSNARLRSTPQRYPERAPPARNTRWHGMATAIL